MRDEYAYLGNKIGLTVLFNGNYCYVDTEDISLTPHLIRYGEWEKEVTKIFLEKLPSNGCVFDIGANIGYYSLLAANRNNQVYAFDPIPKYMELLEMSSAINGFKPRIHCETLALGETETTIQFHINKKFKGSSSITRKWAKEDEEVITTNMVTLDKYCRDNGIAGIDFMKIDAEAYEFEILLGSKVIIERLLIEFNTEIYKNQGPLVLEQNWQWLLKEYSNIQCITPQGTMRKIGSLDELLMQKDNFHMLYCSNE